MPIKQNTTSSPKAVYILPLFPLLSHTKSINSFHLFSNVFNLCTESYSISF